ncbi:MAG: hypothetical protein ACTSV5_03190 [Promethearchaeota archaeon]
MNRIKIIDGYPCIEFPEGILRSYIDLLITGKNISIQNLKDLKSKEDLMHELKNNTKKYE